MYLKSYLCTLEFLNQATTKKKGITKPTIVLEKHTSFGKMPLQFVLFIYEYYLTIYNWGKKKDESLENSKKLSMILEPITWKCSSN